jgi:hypothetical protein
MCPYCARHHPARLMGAAKVLLKPFTNAVLIAAIDELLPGDV